MMATRERPRQRPDETSEHEDDPLAYEAAFGLDGDITDEDVEEFLDERAAEDEQREKKPGFLNLQTGAGLAVIAIGMVYLLQQIGFFPLGYSLGALVALLPWLAGVLIILTGFGVLSWSPSRRRRKQRQATRQRTQRPRPEKTAGRARPASGASPFEQAWQSAERAVREAERRASGAAARASSRTSSRRDGRKRLAKGLRNKKIAGVASGIANYLGIDPTLVRIAFVIGAIFGNGFTIPLYLILSFVMPAGENEGGGDDPVVTIVRDR